MTNARRVAMVAAIGPLLCAANGDDGVPLKMRLAYPPEARQAGHQGTVVVAITVQPDGTLTDARIIESSRSPLLDKAALDATAAATVDLAQRPRKAVTVNPEFPFYNVSLVAPARGLAQLTCADFVADVRWFEQAWPERKRQDVRDYQVMLAPFLYAAVQTPTKEAMLQSGRAIQRTRAQLDRTIDACAATPEALFTATFEAIKAGDIAAKP